MFSMLDSLLIAQTSAAAYLHVAQFSTRNYFFISAITLTFECCVALAIVPAVFCNTQPAEFLTNKINHDFSNSGCGESSLINPSGIDC